jgi:hypothetical protein
VHEGGGVCVCLLLRSAWHVCVCLLLRSAWHERLFLARELPVVPIMPDNNPVAALRSALLINNKSPASLKLPRHSV